MRVFMKPTSKAAIEAELREIEMNIQFMMEERKILSIALTSLERIGESDRLTANKNPKKEDVAKAVHDILSKNVGHPMKVTEILSTLEERGVVIFGKKPSAVLTAMLWRTRDKFNFIKHDDGGYYLNRKREEIEVKNEG